MDEHGRSAVERPALLAYLVFRLCARGFATDRQKSILDYKAFSAYNSRLRLDLDGYTRTRGNRSRTCPASLRHIGGNRSHEETKDSRCTERRASENPQKGKQCRRIPIPEGAGRLAAIPSGFGSQLPSFLHINPSML